MRKSTLGKIEGCHRVNKFADTSSDVADRPAASGHGKTSQGRLAQADQCSLAMNERAKGGSSQVHPQQACHGKGPSDAYTAGWCDVGAQILNHACCACIGLGLSHRGDLEGLNHPMLRWAVLLILSKPPTLSPMQSSFVTLTRSLSPQHDCNNHLLRRPARQVMIGADPLESADLINRLFGSSAAARAYSRAPTG